MGEKEEKKISNTKSIIAIFIGIVITYVIFISGRFASIIAKIPGMTSDMFIVSIFITGFLIAAIIDYAFHNSIKRSIISGLISCGLILLTIIILVATYLFPMR